MRTTAEVQQCPFGRLFTNTSTAQFPRLSANAPSVRETTIPPLAGSLTARDEYGGAR